MNVGNSFYTEDTIAAIATPLGKGAIGVIKISGKEALSILKKVFKPKNPKARFESHRLYYGVVVHPDEGDVIDEVLAVYMKAPKTYTKEDVVEIYAHSGVFVLRKILEAVLLSGARPAQPGEFTLRAFLNGRIDLSQAEAIEELISAKSETGVKLALSSLFGGISEKVEKLKKLLVEVLSQVETAIDFPEEDIDIMQPEELRNKIEKEVIPIIDELIKAYKEGRLYKEGITLVIAGKPNVGKSSLMNALLREERAIVTPIPGTTRDFLEEEATIEGIPVKLVDTAGLRETEDAVEKIGVERARKKFKEADLIIFMVDAGEKPSPEDEALYQEIKNFPHLVVINKVDLRTSLKEWHDFFKKFNEDWVEISVKESQNLDELSKKIVEKLLGSKESSIPEVAPSLRQKVLLEQARERLVLATRELEKPSPFPELVALELRGALSHLSEVVGEVTTEDVLTEIFSKFCIGK